MAERVDPQGGFFDLDAARISQPRSMESAQMQPRVSGQVLPSGPGILLPTQLPLSVNHFTAEMPYYPVGILQSSSGSRVSYSPNVSNIYLIPLIVARNAVLDSIAMWVKTAGAAGAKMRLGLYSSHAFKYIPETLLLDSGDITTDSSGVKTVAASIPLTAGALYFVAINPQTISATFDSVPLSGAMILPNMDIARNAGGANGITNNENFKTEWTYPNASPNALPATLTEGSLSVVTFSNRLLPWVRFSA